MLGNLKVPFTRPAFVSMDFSSGDSVMISADEAEQIMRECWYEKQRRINDDRALGLAEAIEHGTFLPNTQLAFARLSDRLILVNGYHRLTAVSLCKQAQAFRIEIYPCRSVSEVDALYLRFDQPGGARTLTQLGAALGLADEHFRRSSVTWLMRAIPLLMMNLERLPALKRPRASRDMDRKKEEALRWKPWALDYQSCLDGGIAVRTTRYRNAGVVAVALATLRYQNVMAKVFWAESIRDSALESDDPRHALHLHLATAKKSVHEFALAEAACNAWNAFFRNRRLTFCRSLGHPLRVLGTPFQGDE